MILNSKQTFRRDLARLGEVVDLKTQLILLTATLPKRYEVDLLKTLYLDYSGPKIYRGSTERPNIRYTVRRDISIEEALSFIRKQDEEILPDQILIYTRTREQAREFSKRLNYSVYYSDSPRKEKVLREFLEGRIRALVTTSSLSYGVDRPNIRAIIHYGLPYRLYDYAQETGRAGRDGSFSEVFLLLPPVNPRSSLGFLRPTPDDIFENDVIQRYISTTCRRAVLNSYLDGRPQEKCSLKVVTCDFYSGYIEGKVS